MTSPADRALAEADSIVGSILEFSLMAVERRRKQAAWFWVYRARRAEYARTRAAKRWWQFLARISRAKMDANNSIEVCKLVDRKVAMLPRRGVV